MSVPPITNSSFLHGDGKPAPSTEKTVYATIDSLALKRATLPLQLLPVDDKNAKTGTTNDSATRKSSIKVNRPSPSSRQLAKYLVVVPSGKPEEFGPSFIDAYYSSIVERQDGNRKILCLSNTVSGGDNGDIDVSPISLAKITDSCYYPAEDEDTTPASRDRRANESPSDDYEKIESPPVAATWWTVPGEASGDDASCSRKTFVKSKSTNDLTTKSAADRLDEEDPLGGTFSVEKLGGSLLFGNEHLARDKKKKHFAKHVLHFVPDYLGKSSKRRGKRKGELNGSFNSLKALSMDSKHGTGLKSKHRSRSLSRDEFKCLKISSPTNFVHVASATNPSLVSSENTVKFNLEQSVITHAEKCATLPLLVASIGCGPCPGQPLDGVAPVSSTIADKHKSDPFDVARLRRDLLQELQERSAKALEPSQQVKTSETSLPSSRANFSFLWSSRAREQPENAREQATRSASTGNPTDDDVGGEYDDVGPLKLASHQEDEDYDDVGTGIGDLSANFQHCDSIYDDVVSPSDTRHALFSSNMSEKSRDPSGGDDELGSNEYCNVDEDDPGANSEDVYDDVGFPGEERVNSIYAGSTTDSILGSTLNGKESEWEDLEESSASRSNFSTGAQTVGSRKKPGHKWYRKTRRQRSKVAKRNQRCSSKLATRDPTLQVTVSLGRGSALLVGCAERQREQWGQEECRTPQDDSRRTQGLVQIRVIDLDEDVDTQEASCYVHEDDSTSDETTYESFESRLSDDFSSAGETDTVEKTMDQGCKVAGTEQANGLVIEYLEAPTKPNPPPPREASLTRTLGRRIKMLRRTWSITKGSLGRMRRRTSVQDDHAGEETRESNEHSNLDGGRYFSFTRHFKKNVDGPLSTFYLNGTTANVESNPVTDVEPMYSNSSRSTDHYSMLADQEPLYQFYAEAAARGAFDSNSDGYEEVESKIPSRSTTDLAKPGHRTLWCQTPQVMNNGLLERLSPEEKRIQEAKFEILTSEASYLNSLRVLRDEFLNDASVDEVLTQAEKDKLFADIPNVLHASEQFLAELETLWRRDPMLDDLADLLLRYADKCLDIYVPYCSNQVSIDAALKDLRTRKGSKFSEIISRIEARQTCQSLSLHSFLMLPMQRITRLPLLADAVLSKLSAERADKSEWERVLSSLSYVVTECNEAARAAAKEMEMENLARKLEYSVKIKPIVLKGRHLIKSGPVVQLSAKVDAEYKLTFGKRFHKTPLYLLLLTDHLLVAKCKSSSQTETYTVIDTCKRSLIALESLPEDSPFAGRNAMLLTLLENHAKHQVEYVLTCDSDTERQRWLEAVSPTKRGSMEETLYEVWDCPQVVALYCHSPNQPDELSLHPGDVINVLRKMSDGWYQGEKLLNGEQGWFPGNYTKEVASEHVRAKNLKQRHRFLALSANPLHRKAKQQ